VGGPTITWERQRELLRADSLYAPLRLTLALRTPKGWSKVADRVAADLVALAETLDTSDPHAEALDWCDGWLTDPRRDLFARDLSGRDEHASLRELRDWQPPGGADEPHPWRLTPTLLDTATGRRYVLRAPFKRWIRDVYDVGQTMSRLKGLMAEVGWQAKDRQAWPPDGSRRDHVRVARSWSPPSGSRGDDRPPAL
jgi:hypothetical protein